MTIQTWNTGGVSGNSIPNSTAMNHLPLGGGSLVFEHVLGSTAPVVGSWLGLIPRNFTGFSIPRLEIDIPYCDSGGTIRWQLGVFVYDTGVMKTGDISLFAGEQLNVNGSGVFQILLVNGQASTGTNPKYTAGIFANSSSLIRVAPFDLLELTPPSDRFSDSSLGIGLVCTDAPTTWLPTDAAPKKLIVSLTTVPKAVRS